MRRDTTGKRIDLRGDVDDILHKHIPDTEEIFNRDDLIAKMVDEIVDRVKDHMQYGVDTYIEEVTK